MLRYFYPETTCFSDFAHPKFAPFIYDLENTLLSRIHKSFCVLAKKKKGGKEKSTTNHKKNKSNETSDLNSVNVSV